MKNKGRKTEVGVSLSRVLSKWGIASRTIATQWIKDGRVQVDGKVEKNPERRMRMGGLEPRRILIDGKPIAQNAWRAVLLHKPRGVVTTRSDERGRKTVYDVLSVEEHLACVGRLDLATSGLLIFTNDTQFAAWILEPENKVPREYVVVVRGDVQAQTIEALLRGVRIDGEVHQATRIEIQKNSRVETRLLVELCEGKNREIRNMFKSFGHEVTKLKRISFGGLLLGDLEPGKWRELSQIELKRAFPKAPLRKT